MRTPIACLALLTASCAGLHGRDDRAADRVEWIDYGENPMMSPEYSAAMTKAVTPGEVHAELAKGVGHYQVDMRYWPGPDSDPIPLRGIANVEMILGGRYMLQEFHSDSTGPFEGLMLLGYDNLAEEYWSLWIDSEGTGFSLTTGRANEAGDIVLTGTMRDPMTPKGRPYRTVTEHGADGTFTLHIYDSGPDGREYRSMELVYERS